MLRAGQVSHVARELLYVREVAASLRLSRQTIYRMVDKGLIESIRVTPHVLRIPASEVDRILADRSGEFTRSQRP